MGSTARFGPAGGREVGTRPSARAGLDEGFYLHQQGPARISSRHTSAAVRGRSSGPMQPAAGISAPSTETICGPKLRPEPGAAAASAPSPTGLGTARQCPVIAEVNL
jgi:hypothetical protein